MIAFPLLLILFGIIQAGFLFSGQNGLTNAAREAARYASTLPTPDMTVACTGTGNNAGIVSARLLSAGLPQYVAGFRAANVVAGTNCVLVGSGTRVAYCARANGDGTFAIRVRVRAVYRHPLFIPLVGRIFSSSDTWQLEAVEEMRVEGPNRSTAGGFSTC